MKPSRILSLDLATTTGFARHANGITDAGHIAFTRKHGRKTIPDDHEGIVFLRFLRWLNTRIIEDKPEVIIYERPGHFASAGAAFMASGLRGILYCNAAHHGIPIVCYSPSTLKKWATGSGKAEKPAMVARARLLEGGEDLTDDNACDALLGLHYYLSL
jgi:hypothetical protein